MGALSNESSFTETDRTRELEKGRVALWLSVEDLSWLSTHCCCTDQDTKEARDRCARVRFRARAALHKSGIKVELGEPGEQQPAAD